MTVCSLFSVFSQVVCAGAGTRSAGIVLQVFQLLLPLLQLLVLATLEKPKLGKQAYHTVKPLMKASPDVRPLSIEATTLNP